MVTVKMCQFVSVLPQMVLLFIVVNSWPIFVIIFGNSLVSMRKFLQNLRGSDLLWTALMIIN